MYQDTPNKKLSNWQARESDSVWTHYSEILNDLQNVCEI